MEDRSVFTDQLDVVLKRSWRMKKAKSGSSSDLLDFDKLRNTGGAFSLDSFSLEISKKFPSFGSVFIITCLWDTQAKLLGWQAGKVEVWLELARIVMGLRLGEIRTSNRGQFHRPTHTIN